MGKSLTEARLYSMIKKQVIGFEKLPDITVRELTAKDLLDFELGNEILDEDFILNNICKTENINLTDNQKQILIDEFYELHEKKNDDKSDKKISEVIAFLITNGHLNVLDYGITFLNVSAESVYQNDERVSRINMLSNLVGSRGNDKDIQEFSIYKKPITEDDMIDNMNELENML